MALKTVIPFPIFSPFPTTSTTTTTTTTTTEVRFSRWNNANAEKFERNRQTQHQIEDDLRRLRRFESAINISNFDDNTDNNSTTFKSIGTPSTPSLPSIPGKKSKYSKPVKNPNPNSSSQHPAFRRVPKRAKLPGKRVNSVEGEADIKVGENGLKYMVPGAPFEYMYSYTETPKNVKPLALREAAVTPFGPGTMGRPWTGKKPLPGSKKELPQFDSFRVPEAGKKGVKPVQKPGPFLPGSGPRYVMSREEVLGEELTKEEVKELVDGCRKTKRQLNMGRDGLTHNMLDNIHAHWKRRRVCKIKCKGVCTVDMDNVCQQLEEKTGGKIIYHRGGIVYLFRGRNYNYKTRPRFPLMLWKPVTPVYPRLVKRVPEGLTLEEATDMRKRGRELIPICKLGKNGVYANLVNNVKEAFEACELVRINCQGMNPSDYRKIGAKLKDLVPCVLISFEHEHILMWRGRDWKSSILSPEDSAKDDNSSGIDSPAPHGSSTVHYLDSEDEEESPCFSSISNEKSSVEHPNEVGATDVEDKSFVNNDASLEVNVAAPSQTSALEYETITNINDTSSDDIDSAVCPLEEETRIVDEFSYDREPPSVSTQSGSGLDADSTDNLDSLPGNSSGDLAAYGDSQGESETSHVEPNSSMASPCTEGLLYLLRQAVESGSAMTLDGISLDADVVYERSVALAQVAPHGPVFRHRPQKVAIRKVENEKSGGTKVDEAVPVAEPSVSQSNEKKTKQRKSPRLHKVKDFTQEFLDVVPQGSLKIDELAKLLT